MGFHNFCVICVWFWTFSLGLLTMADDFDVEAMLEAPYRKEVRQSAV